MRGERVTPPSWGLLAAIAVLHLAAFGLLLLQGTFAIGIGLTAYTLGLRHAFDADHIAAIDNATRRLMADGQRPLTVGFFFALGHSTIVLLAVALFALGVPLAGLTGELGTTVSATFLLLIAAVNLVLLIGMLGNRGGAGLQPGVLNRAYGRVTRVIRRPWHMVPLGALFGLGLDTAAEVALLLVAAGAVLGHMALTAVICLPLLFAAGMCLVDTLDGAFMRFAYGWSLSVPDRRRYCNIAMTALSIAVAVVVAMLELVGADLELLGYAVVGLFALAWGLVVAVRRLATAT
jgi:nickel/cobalt transporter (NiCoT) family protein